MTSLKAAKMVHYFIHWLVQYQKMILKQDLIETKNGLKIKSSEKMGIAFRKIYEILKVEPKFSISAPNSWNSEDKIKILKYLFGVRSKLQSKGRHTKRALPKTTAADANTNTPSAGESNAAGHNIGNVEKTLNAKVGKKLLTVIEEENGDDSEVSQSNSSNVKKSVILSKALHDSSKAKRINNFKNERRRSVTRKVSKFATDRNKNASEIQKFTEVKSRNTRRSLKLEPGSLMRKRRSTAKQRDLNEMRAFLESSAKKYEKITAQKEADIKKKAEHMAELERIEKEKNAAEAKRLAEEEAARKAIEEKAKHMAELERIEKEKKAAEAKRLAEEEAARKAIEEKAKHMAELERIEKEKKAAEAKRLAEEEAARKAIEEKAKHMAELERIEKEKKAAEAKRLAEEEAARKAIEEKAKHMAELERIEKEKKAAEAKRLAEEEAARKAIEEKAKHMAELERIEKEKKAAEAKRLAEEEAARKAIEEKAKHMAELERIEKEKKAAEAKRLAEEEAARKAIEEKAKRMEMLDRNQTKNTSREKSLPSVLPPTTPPQPPSPPSAADRLQNLSEKGHELTLKAPNKAPSNLTLPQPSSQSKTAATIPPRPTGLPPPPPPPAAITMINSSKKHMQKVTEEDAARKAIEEKAKRMEMLDRNQTKNTSREKSLPSVLPPTTPPQPPSPPSAADRLQNLSEKGHELTLKSTKQGAQ